ncbi:SDR family NAD(P)-dependent oxidoreductase [Paraburkholderia sp. BR14374]|uniref:SDR family NAD(P)-dependent oxidoreductase n=1 Tax=Paraburkholderia sp. BR14374 TaxID=3237007 RepID=UPI0034CD706A
MRDIWVANQARVSISIKGPTDQSLTKNHKRLHHNVGVDVTNEAEWKLAVQQAVDSFGKLDILVNNAGIVPKVAPIEERTVEEWDQVMAVNARGVFLGTKIAIPEMRKAGSGSIVNVSSIAALGHQNALSQEITVRLRECNVSILPKQIVGHF